ncbi:MAG: glycosyltransferase family 4 protein [Acidobacteriota bacterium]
MKFYEHIEGTADFLSNMDVFISHSFWEGQQVALLEAMASGCYCLSHRWMGVEEVLPEDNLYLMEDELIAKIAAYAACPPRRDRNARR